MSLNQNDFNELESKFLAAKKSVQRIKYRNPEENDYYPIYPDEILAFLEFLSSSSWINHSCSRTNAERSFNEISTAEINDIRDCLGWYVITERFAQGAWGKHLESGRIETVINRAREIIRRDLEA